MKITSMVVLCLLLSGIANAGLLDIIRHGVEENPDRYVYLELLGTKQHDSGVNSVQYFGNQMSRADSQGMRGQLTIPLDANSSFLFGGGWSTGNYSYDGTSYLLSQTGVIKSYNIEAGFRFYVHE